MSSGQKSAFDSICRKLSAILDRFVPECPFFRPELSEQSKRFSAWNVEGKIFKLLQVLY